MKKSGWLHTVACSMVIGYSAVDTVARLVTKEMYCRFKFLQGMKKHFWMSVLKGRLTLHAITTLILTNECKFLIETHCYFL